MVLAQVPSGVPHLSYQVSWEKLSDDYVLPDEPVENTSQPLLAASLRESLELIDISKKQCRDAINRVSTRVVHNAQLISGDV